jgi:hypothetical protein
MPDLDEYAEPTPVEPDVFWDSARYAPDDIEAVRPDGVRVRPVMLVGGRRLGFEEPLPEGTEIFRHGTPMWSCAPAALLVLSIERAAGQGLYRPSRSIPTSTARASGPPRSRSAARRRARLTPISRPSSSVPLDRSREASLVSELVRPLLARRRISATSMRRMCCGLISI